MAIRKYVVKFTNSDVDPSNYQLVDFDVDSPSDEDAAVAGILAYIMKIRGLIATNSAIAGVTASSPGGAGGAPVAFPTTAYAAQVTFDPTLPTATSYAALPFLGGVLAPLGTSISVSEVTATPGRTGRGRHFLPYIATSTIDSNGYVDPVILAAIESAASDFLSATSLTGIWCVTGPASPTAKAIVQVKAQPVFSNLESRRR